MTRRCFSRPAFTKSRSKGISRRPSGSTRRCSPEHLEARPLAATALLRLGICHEKLGNDEARGSYERLIREYSDQRDPAAEARRRLDAMTRPTDAAEGMVVRRIWWGSGADPSGAPSPGGRYLSFTNWMTNDLARRDLETGENRDLTREGTWNEPNQHAYFSVWSPDGQQIAYAWFNKDRYELRVVDREGGEPRVVFRNGEAEFVHPAGFSPDGRNILTVVRHTDGTHQICFVSVADGFVRTLKSLDWRFPVKVSLSPDGRYIVYDFPPNADSPERDIYLLASDGSKETRLVEHPAMDYGPIWTPDGKSVLFGSDRAGYVGAWLVPVADGELQGAPRLIKRDMERMWPMGFTEAGALFYGFTTWEACGDVYVADVDWLSRTSGSSSRRIAQNYEGSNATPAWSRNANHLAYLSQRGPLPRSVGSWLIVIRGMDSSEERVLEPRLASVSNASGLRWTPDGRFVVASGIDFQGVSGLYRIDVVTGDATLLIASEPRSHISRPEFSPDGKRAFFMRRREESADYVSSIIVRDLASGCEDVLHRGLMNNNLALAPDGRTLAFYEIGEDAYPDALKVLSTDGGEPREIFDVRAERTPDYIGLAFSPDSREVVFGRPALEHRLEEDGNLMTIELWRIAVEGGEPSRIGLAAQMLRQLAVHPVDGRIAFTSGNPEDLVEVWVMEKFLPESH